MANEFVGRFPETDDLRRRLENAYRADETATVNDLIGRAQFDDAARDRVQARATALVEEIRDQGVSAGGLDAFLQEYELSNQEGVCASPRPCCVSPTRRPPTS